MFIGALFPFQSSDFQFLREEGSTLRAELSQRHQEDIRTAVAEIVSRKEQELKAVNEKWRQEIEDLGQQVMLLVVTVAGLCIVMYVYTL